jgi:hypothetical protein
MVLARHHAVETVLDGERGLRAHLVDDLWCVQIEMRIQAQRDVHGRAW